MQVAPLPGSAADRVRCAEHDRVSLGCCLTCGRTVCAACLATASSPRDFACPGCGDTGALLDDGDPGRTPVLPSGL